GSSRTGRPDPFGHSAIPAILSHAVRERRSPGESPVTTTNNGTKGRIIMAYYRMRPPKNEQDYLGSCWAAAIDSFSVVTSGVPRLREDDLVDRFSSSENGWLNRDDRKELERYLATHG